MRMRLKRNLGERLNTCGDYLLVQENYDFYSLSEEQRTNIVDLEKVFGNNNPIVLELGCGKGKWAIESAKANPNKNYLAVEKLSNVIICGCENAKDSKLTNLRFVNVGVENLLYYLPKHCANEVVLNFSCPFPKKTYANRRLTYKNYLEKYKLLLTEDGIISQKTDNKDFFEWSKESLTNNGFEITFETDDLHSTNVPNIMTEYETKFTEQHMKIFALKAKIKNNH